MSRSIEITLPSEKTDSLVEELRDAEGVVGVSLQRGASVKPPGDVLTVQATNAGLEVVLQLIERHKIGERGSVMTSEPRSLDSPSQQNEIDRETNEASWPEMATLLRNETNVTNNYVMAMSFSGVVAASGLWSDTLHLVIGAMVIAPGFEPILRVPFGLLGGERHSWTDGLISTAVGYTALAIGGAIAFLALAVLQPSETALGEGYWVQYWSTLTPVSVLVALAGGGAGAAIIAAQRSVLSAGVMVALALIPSASILGMGLAAGDFALAGKGLLRWGVDVVCVVLAGGLVLLVKQRTLRHRRGSVRASGPL